uniref:7TM_GPCR_Srx domain-containing protein n=1 Tax=Haemonchus contortus TaxID=6289 RepID=A0A7I4YRK4_HAECO
MHHNVQQTVIEGIADVFSILVACFHRLNHELGLGPEFKTVVFIMIVLGGTTFLTHIIGKMLLAFNRYSALRFPDTYDKIWCRRNVWIVILLQYIVAFAIFTQMFGVELLYEKGADGRYTFADVDSLSKWKTRYLYGGVGLIYAIISVTLNIKVFVAWRKLPRIRGKSSISRHEKGLLLYTTLVFASTMLMCLQQVLRVIATLSGNNDFDLWVTMQFFWINDVMVCVPPFCLVVLSADLRRDIIRFFLCTRHQNKLTPSVSVLNRQSTIRK